MCAVGHARQGIGEVLLEMRQRTFREVLTVHRAEAGEWATELDLDPAASVLVRLDTLCHELSSAILVEEVFPHVAASNIH